MDDELALLMRVAWWNYLLLASAIELGCAYFLSVETKTAI